MHKLSLQAEFCMNNSFFRAKKNTWLKSFDSRGGLMIQTYCKLFAPNQV